MILAAGRGERMRHLTRETPKPMLQAGGKPLIQYQVENLVRSGITEIIINHGIQGEQIESWLGNGTQFGARIQYSAEGSVPLETGGGILQALPLLGEEPFIVVNADIWTDYPYQQLPRELPGQAHLVLVDNPAHHPHGDFYLRNSHVHNSGAGTLLTFSGIAVYSATLFADCRPGHFPLTPLLRAVVQAGEVTGEHYQGTWLDIGTPERLSDLQTHLCK